MQEKSNTTDDGADAHEATLETLRLAFERNRPGFRTAAQGTRASVTASINHLARLAGIEQGKATRAELYDEAVRALSAGGRPAPPGVAYVRHLCEDIRREWEENPLNPNYVKRLKQAWYYRADTLSRALGHGYTGWREYEAATDEERAEIMREIAALADFAGVGRAETDFYTAYVEALKHLGGTDEDHPSGVRLREIAAEIGGRVKESYRNEDGEAKVVAHPASRAESSVPREPAQVISMAAWLSSHPRPINNLLFAEKV
jgi:hypothetical protein